jgi:predicted phosphodiesterase
MYHSISFLHLLLSVHCQFCQSEFRNQLKIMRIVIFSDLHNLVTGFNTVLRYAQRKNADRLLYLGDLGDNPVLLDALHSREISCIFGNWEVSGLRRLSPKWASWVATWPAKIEIDNICYTHATPELPTDVTTTAEAAKYIEQGIGWAQLFPRLHNNEEARWSAWAALETRNQRAAFHGHTHIQQVWVNEAGRWRSFDGPAEFTLEAGTPEYPTRYLIGIGSAGAPQDGRDLRFALYDDSDKCVELLAVPPPARD